MPDIDRTAPDAEWYDDVPRSVSKFALFGTVLLVATFGGFGLWAFGAPLAAAVIAQGSFVATGQNKIVQHLEGGIIKRILVQEGDKVQAGQLLLELDETLADANQRELFLRQIRLEATEARLRAEYQQAAQVSYPTRVLENSTDSEVASIIDSQELSFRVSRTSLENDISLLRSNIDALNIRTVGYEAELAAHKQQATLLAEELQVKKHLLTRGLSRRAEVTALQRTVLEADGQIGRLQAQIDEITEVQQKYQKQIRQVTADYSETALNELQKVQAELEGVREKLRAVQSVRARIDIVAPVSGTVIRMYYHTAGGVVETGRPIVEILPADEPLIIEVQIPRADIDSVHSGQPAMVRLTALNQRTTPTLSGEVFYVSADAISDTSTGVLKEVYIARVSLPPSEIGRVPGFTPTPGMPAEIMIQTAERTFAQYIAKPIKDSMSRAFREN